MGYSILRNENMVNGKSEMVAGSPFENRFNTYFVSSEPLEEKRFW
jgi:hypothetical protein